MPRPTNRLSARQVATTKTEGWHADGAGLYLRVDKAGARRWVYVFQWLGKRKEMGLGSASVVSLADARQARDRARADVSGGVNPIALRATPKAAGDGRTFGEVATSLIDDLEAGWKSAVHRKQWRSSLKMYAKPIWDTQVDEVTTDDVLALLKPIWAKVPETANRVRGRIERVLDAAKARGHRTGENPARWKGHLALMLPPRKGLVRGHHMAMPFEDVPGFMIDLAARPAVAARCLELTVLTAVRSSEALKARKSEVDLVEAIWTIPADRMKAGAEHRVPLVGRALEIMAERCAAADEKGYLFPSDRALCLSGMAMEMLMRRMGYGPSDRVKAEVAKPNYTVHGMRSAFRDWAGDRTEFAEEIAEAALAHTVGSKVRRAYRRGDALEKRRELMTAWDAFAMSRPVVADPAAALMAAE